LSLRDQLKASYLGKSMSVLAAGQTVVEEFYRLDFPFDGRTTRAEVTFAHGSEILIGTHFLREYRLEINFKTRIVLLTRLNSKTTRRKK
jgi:hypothetical protein